MNKAQKREDNILAGSVAAADRETSPSSGNFKYLARSDVFGIGRERGNFAFSKPDLVHIDDASSPISVQWQL
jgi:hypothetical protein